MINKNNKVPNEFIELLNNLKNTINYMHNTNDISKEVHKKINKFINDVSSLTDKKDICAYTNLLGAFCLDILGIYKDNNLFNLFKENINIDKNIPEDFDDDKYNKWVDDELMYIKFNDNEIFMSENFAKFVEDVYNDSNMHTQKIVSFTEPNDDDDNDGENFNILFGITHDKLLTIGIPLGPCTKYKFKFIRYENGAYMDNESTKYFRSYTNNKFNNNIIYFKDSPDSYLLGYKSIKLKLN